MQVAYEEMKSHGIRHLPVVDHTGKLVGILSDRDVQRAINVKMINEVEQEMTFAPHDTVENFMSWPVQTVDEKTSITDLTRMMIELKVSAFVVNGPNQYVKGIITTEDLLKYLLELLITSEYSRNDNISKLHWDHV
jgi:CBS-domain-containing membrane protein